VGKIYKDQSALRIVVKTFCDLDGIKAAFIKYIKPNGDEGEFSAVVIDPVNGILSYECSKGDINVAGWWDMWAYIVFEDDRTAAGETVEVHVWRKGSG